MVWPSGGRWAAAEFPADTPVAEEDGGDAGTAGMRSTVCRLW
jgi:hypothetical protein